MQRRWVIFTGEYPPMPGGVADYARQVAVELEAHGDEVHIIAPPIDQPAVDARIAVHTLPDHFGPRSLISLGRILSQIPHPRTLLLQYVPHAFGYRSINVPFCTWWAMQRGERRAVMFHEVSSPIDLRFSVKHSILGAVHRPMAAMLIRSADHIFVSTESWRPMLESLGAGRHRVTNLPIPSNMPESTDAAEVAIQRAKLAGNARFLIGSFGTFGAYVAPLLAEVIRKVVANIAESQFALIGRGARNFVQEYFAHEELVLNRLSIADGLGSVQVASSIAACDVMIQPYQDGVSTRRTSLMAGLALGVPVISNKAHSTESIWQNSGACAVCDSVEQMADETIQLLQSDARRRTLGDAGRVFYRERFSLRHVVAIMRDQCSQQI